MPFGHESVIRWEQLRLVRGFFLCGTGLRGHYWLSKAVLSKKYFARKKILRLLHLHLQLVDAQVLGFGLRVHDKKMNPSLDQPCHKGGAVVRSQNGDGLLRNLIVQRREQGDLWLLKPRQIFLQGIFGRKLITEIPLGQCLLQHVGFSISWVFSALLVWL